MHIMQESTVTMNDIKMKGDKNMYIKEIYLYDLINT